MKTIIFCGGHHNSSIPLAKKFKNDGCNIVYVGHKVTQKRNRELSSEYKEVTALGFSFINFVSPKFYKNNNPLKYLYLFGSLTWSFLILIKYRPCILVSFGGYLAVPLCLAAKILGIKIVTHEQTVTMGMANRVIAKVADIIFLSWLPKITSPKYQYVGLPLREEILSIKPRGNSREFKTVFITGGKQASHAFNQFVFDNIDNLLKVKDFRIIHQTAKNSQNDDYQKAQYFMEKYGQSKYWAFDYAFGDTYKKVLSTADFLLSRSGAHITYELCYLKIPAILVPLSWVSQNEQEENAKKAVEFFPCVILNEVLLTIDGFKKSVDDLVKVCSKKKTYGNVPLDATEKMYLEISKLIQ